MTIFFRTYEAAMLHARDEHDVDCDYLRTAIRFENGDVRGHADILSAAAVLHETGYFTDVQSVLDFFEKPYNYCGEVWSAAAAQAGIDPDECDECD